MKSNTWRPVSIGTSARWRFVKGGRRPTADLGSNCLLERSDASIVVMKRSALELAATELQSTPRNPPPRADRWVAWPAIATLAIALVVAVLCSLPGVVSFLLIPLTVLGAPLVGMSLLVIALVVAARRRPRTAVSILVAVLLPVLLWKPVTWTADCMHLALTVWTGAGQLGVTSRPHGSPFATYDCSVGFAGGPDTFLIYDATDEIALSPKLHKQPIAFEQGFGEDCAGKVTHLLDHYYVCRS